MARASRAPTWWLVGPDVLVALTVLATVAWAVTALLDGRTAVAAAPAVTTTALAVVALVVRSRSGLPARTPVLPVWFVPVVLLVAAGSAVGWGAADGTTDGVAVGAAALVTAGPAAAVLAGGGGDHRRAAAGAAGGAPQAEEEEEHADRARAAADTAATRRSFMGDSMPHATGPA
ncbi:hypothetical protein AERO_01745, partial [Aeromicrobium fastidiosum]|uniref:hypothetical protein n=1 Tax=Aeromicrobium fastidiosum TaxID=52699 RepID=UPI00403F53DE|nr:hypothetical protein [Aeromicrobium fastidiosum]